MSETDTDMNKADMDNINTAIADGLGKEITEHTKLETCVYGPSIGATLTHAMVVVSDVDTDIEKLRGQLFYIQIENATATLVPINTIIERVLKKEFGKEQVQLETTNPDFPDNLLQIMGDLQKNSQEMA